MTDTTPERLQALERRVEAIEAFILRRPTEPIPISIIDQAIAQREADQNEEESAA